MKPWQRNLAVTLGGAALVGAGSVAWHHLGIEGTVWTWVAKAEDLHEVTVAEATEQSEIKDLVEILGERAKEDDAKRARTIELCKDDQISLCRTCRDVGVPDTTACKQ